MNKRIRYTKEFVELITDNIPALVAYLDTDMRYVFVNAVYGEWFGMAPHEIIGKHIKDVLGDQGYETVRPRVQKVLTGKKISYEDEIPVIDGKSRYYHADYIPHFESQGQVNGFFVLVRDISERKENEQELEKYRLHLEEMVNERTRELDKSNIKLHEEYSKSKKINSELQKALRTAKNEKTKTEAIIAGIGDGISIQDRDFKVLYQNAIHKDFFGEHEGEYCYKAYEQRDSVCEGCPVARSFEDEEIHNVERESPINSEVTYAITASPLRDEEGKIVAGIEVVRDITQRKKTEKALAEVNKELNQILNTVANGIVVIDKEKNIINANREFLIMARLPAEEVIGQKCNDVFGASVCDTEDCPLTKILNGEEIVRVEVEKKRRDGTFMPCDVTATPLIDAEGKLIGMVEDFRDLTEKRKMEQESFYQQQQIVQADKLAALGTVVAGVAHEINNPNSFISYNAPMAEKMWQGVKPVLDEYAAKHPEWRVRNFTFQELAESMEETLGFIQTGSERINKIVNNLKEFSSQDEKKEATHLQVNEVIKQAYTIIGTELRKKVGKVDLNLDDTLPEIYGQFHKIEQVVVNLLINATNAIPEKKSGTLSVSTQYNERLQSVLITIEDNGTGIDKEAMACVFDPFFTTRRDKGGTGLGLSVSYGLIREHKGTFSIFSRKGLGTRVTLYLPLDRRKQEKLTIYPNVLCIDDEQNILELFHTYFHGIKDIGISTLDNPENVVDYLHANPEVDIVFSDVLMPNMSGWDVLTKIKEKFPLMPVVLFSGSPVALEKPEGALSPDYILHKPFQLEEVQTIIESFDRRIQ